MIVHDQKLPLAGQVALVTGAGVRVGRAIATALAHAGAAVAVHYSRSQRQAGTLVKSLAVQGHQARAFQADLRASGECSALVKDVIAWAGRLDILVNSAAAFERRAFFDITESDLDSMLALNLVAPFALARAAGRELMRRRGLIVNIIDVAAFTPWRGFSHYCVAKAGLAMLTKCLTLELAPRARACAIAPGVVAFPRGYAPAMRKRITDKIPLRRVGRPEDIARAVLFLASNDYLNGVLLPVDGGRLAGSMAPDL